MTNIIIALPKLEDAEEIKNILIRNGIMVTGICTTGAQAINLVESVHDGIVICSCKLMDMVYSELHECLPPGFEMLLLASRNLVEECIGNDVVYLSQPLKVNDLVNSINMMMEKIERRRRRKRQKPRVRNAEEDAVIKQAKEVLMTRKQITEEEAHKYLQKHSMDSGTNLVEIAHMVLAMMR